MRRLSAFSCVAALLAAVACRDIAAPALKEPPPLTAEQQASRAEYDARVASEKAAKSMTPQQVAEAEAAWRRNPEDLETLKKLLIYYGPDQSGPVVKDTAANIAARRPLILWLIDHQPESVLTWHSDPRFSKLDPVTDPEGYEQAKKLWLAHTSRPDARAPVLDHAATFFESTDLALTEELLTRARRVDPDAKTLFANGEPGHWRRRFSDLYARALAGSNDAARSAVRQKLDASRDPQLLADVGYGLAIRYGPGPGGGDVGLIELGKTYLQRALQLDPESDQARLGLETRARFDRDIRLDGLLKDVPLDK